LQHFITGANGAFADDESAVNVLIDMVCSLKPIYVKNAKWIMSRSALALVRKLKSADGTYLWQPSLSQSAPSTLLGYPVIIDDDMPAIQADTASTSIAFGDFLSGYQIVDRQGLRILRDPYTSKPFVEFYATKRTGGAVVDYDAIKLLKFEE
jgi:HK97 family phage major capsid protein